MQAQTINFNLLVDTDTTINTLPPVKAKSFDWRKAHGANLNTSPYFDGNHDLHLVWDNVLQTYVPIYEQGNGWMTSVKYQGVLSDSYCPNGCYVYAPIGALEAVVNLYFNHINNNYHLDYDLSEQHLMDCFNEFSSTSDCINGGRSDSLFMYISQGTYIIYIETQSKIVDSKVVAVTK